MQDVDFTIVTQYISVETLVIAGVAILLALVALRLGLSFLIALFVGLLLTEPLMALIPETPVIGPMAASMNPAILGGALFVALVLLIQRLLPDDFLSGTQLFPALTASIAVIAGSLAVWAHSTIFMSIYVVPAHIAYWFAAPFTLLWVLGALLILGFIRNRVGWM